MSALQLNEWMRALGRRFWLFCGLFVLLGVALPQAQAQLNGSFSFDATSYSQEEGPAGLETDVPITIRRAGSVGNVTVTFMTIENTAIAGVDYNAVSNVLAFADGESSKLVTVTIKGNNIAQSWRTLMLLLTNATGGAVISQSLATLTIQDDDTKVFFSSDTYTFSEGATNAVIRITRNPTANSDATVSFYTEDLTNVLVGRDYLALKTNVTFTNMQTTAYVYVPLIDNDIIQTNTRQVTLILDNATNCALGSLTKAILTIMDNDTNTGTIGVSAPVVYVTEDYSDHFSPIEVRVFRSGGTDGPLSVSVRGTLRLDQGQGIDACPGRITAIEDLDYTLSTHSLSWADKEGGSKSYFVTIINDRYLELDQLATIELYNAPGTANNANISNKGRYFYVTIWFDEQPAGANDRYYNYPSVGNQGNPGANNTVYAVIMDPASDGTRSYIGGDFTGVNGKPINKIARISDGGALDTSFNPGDGVNSDGFVQAIAPYPSTSPNAGKVLIGGYIQSVNGISRMGIARLNANGTLDTTFTPGNGAQGGGVWAIAIQSDDKIVIGGDFTFFNSTPRNRIARLMPDGTLDTSFNPGIGVNGPVWAVAIMPNDSGVLLGGEFTLVNGNTRNRIARLNANGSFDASFDPGVGADGTVNAISLLDNGSILVAGEFGMMDVTPGMGIARLTANGVADPLFNAGSGTDGPVYTMAVQNDGRILIGGNFNYFNGTERANIARLFENGILDTSFLDRYYNQTQPGTGFNQTIYSIALQYNGAVQTAEPGVTNWVMIGGRFSDIGGDNAPITYGGSTSPTMSHYRADAVAFRQNYARMIGGVNADGGFNSGSVNQPGNIQFISPTYSVDENTQIGSIVVGISRVNGRLGDVSATYTSTDGSALDGVNYISVSNIIEYGTCSSGVTYISIPIINDILPLGNRVFNLTLSQPTGYPLNSTNQPALGWQDKAAVTIVDDDVVRGTLGFSSAIYYIAENTRTLQVTVTRTNGSNGSITVNYASTNGTATAGKEFVGVNGQLTFRSGETTKTFPITINDNVSVDPERSFTLSLFTPSDGVLLGQSNATVVITDNEAAGRGSLSFSTNDFYVNEAAGEAVITVRRTGGVAGTVSVDFATLNGALQPAYAGADYTATNGTLVFTNTQVTRTFRIPIRSDRFVEGNETISLVLSNVTGGAYMGVQSNAVLTIVDDDFYGNLSFSAPTYFIKENRPYVTVSVVRTAGNSGEVYVDYQTTDGSAVDGIDYLSTSGTLDFPDGVTNQTFDVALIDNGLLDGNRTFSVSLKNFAKAGAGLLTGATVFVIDDESMNVPAGTVDAGFNSMPGANGFVQSIAMQLDGKLLVGGDFTAIDGVGRNRIARLNINGSIDTTFNPLRGANDSVLEIAIQQNQKILVAGAFSTIDVTNRSGIARLNTDGTLDTSFNPGSGVDNPIYAMALELDGRIVIGGAFTKFRESNLPYVAMLNTNGTTDATFQTGTGPNAAVQALAVQPDGKIIIGGDFTTINQQARKYIARLNVDGSLDSSFDSSLAANGSVRAIAVQPNGRILIGGLFTTINGTSLNYLARLLPNGNLDASFNPGTGANGSVMALSLQSEGKIVVVGDFTRFNGVSRSRITRLNQDGSTDPEINFGTGANSFIAAALNQTDDQIVIGGGFTTFNGTARSYLARLIGDRNVGPGTVEFLSANFDSIESVTNAVVTVRRNGGTTGQVSVDYSTFGGTAKAGLDYRDVLGTLVFSEGETLQTFIVPVIDDSLVENPETVNLRLSSPQGGAALDRTFASTLTIISDDSRFVFSEASYYVNENAVSGFATITVWRQGSTNGTVTVDYVTTNGNAVAGVDYVLSAGTLVFLPGETNKSFTVQVVNDNIVKGDRTVQLQLSRATGRSTIGQPVATLTIVDDDFAAGTVRFSSATYRVNDYETNIAITVTRTNGTTGIISIDYATSDGSAVAGKDYVAQQGTLSFASGETTKSFIIPVMMDLTNKPNGTVNLALSNPQGGAILGAPSTAVLTIINNGLGNGSFSFTSTNFLVSETGVVATISVVRNYGTVGNVSVIAATTSTGTAVEDIDYVASSLMMTWVSGEGGVKSFTVPVLNDDLAEGNLTVGLALSQPTGGASLGTVTKATLTIIDDDLRPGFVQFSKANYVVNEDGVGAVITVIRTNGNYGTIAVDYATADYSAMAGTDYVGVFGTLFFTNMQLSATFTVPIIDNPIITPNRTVHLVLKNPVNASLGAITDATLTIIENDPPAGTLDEVFNGIFGPNGPVYSLMFNPARRLYVAGDFTRFNGMTANRIVRLGTNGAVDLGFNTGAGADKPIYAMATDSNGRLALGGDFTTFNGQPMKGLALLEQDGSISTAFANFSGVDSTVYSTIFVPGVTDSKVLIAGAFSKVNGIPQSRLARLNADGSLDDTFNGVGADNVIYTVVAQSDGRLLVGGSFATFRGLPRGRIARLLANGTLDSTFNPGLGADGVVRSVAIQSDGGMIIAGDFSSVDGVPRNRIARLKASGAVDLTFDPGTGANGLIRSVALDSDSKIFAIGDFTTFSGNALNRIVRLNNNGSLDSSFTPGSGANGNIYCLALGFAPGGGTPVPLAKKSPNIVGGHSTTIDQYPYQVALLRTPLSSQTNVWNDQFCGGSIINSRWILTAAHCAVGFAPTDVMVGVGVSDLTHIQPGRIFAVDQVIVHPNYDPITYQNDIALLHLTETIDFSGSTYSASSIALATPTDAATGVTAPGVMATITGWGNMSGTGVVYPFALQESSMPITVDSAYLPGVVSPEMIMAGYLDGRTDVCNGDSGGALVVTNQAGNLVEVGIVSWSYGCAQPYYPAVFTRVSSYYTWVTSQLGGAPVGTGEILLAIGGDFTRFNGLSHSYYAVLDKRGEISSLYDSTQSARDEVYALALYPASAPSNLRGKLLVSGDFSEIVGVANQNRLSRLNVDGTLDTNFNVGFGPDGMVRAMAIQTDSKVVVGGMFTNINFAQRAYLARLNADGTLDTTFNSGVGLDGAVLAVALQSNGKLIVGGLFTTVYGVSRNGIARMNANGTVDATFSPGQGANGSVKAVAVQPDGSILIAGDFSMVDNVPCKGVARLLASGAVDLSFNPGIGTDSSVNAIALQANGRIVIGGVFTNFNGTPASRIARLMPNGSLDASFNAGLGANDYVNSIVLQKDGGMIVVGAFVNFNGQLHHRLVRLDSNGALDPTINFGVGANNIINIALVQPDDGKIVIGGRFTEFNGEIRMALARLNGGTNNGSGTLTLDAPAYTVSEAATNITVTVMRTGGTTGGASVLCRTIDGTAKAGRDYVAVSNILVFAEAETFKTVRITVLDNKVIDGDRIFNVQLENPVGADLKVPVPSSVTIQDNESRIEFAQANYTVSEGVGVARIQVNRIGGTIETANVDCGVVLGGSATPGSDYSASNQRLVFNPGISQQYFEVRIFDDKEIELTETVFMQLLSASPTVALGLTNAVLSIVDNEFGPGSLQFATNRMDVMENAGYVAISIYRTNGYTGGISVNYSTGGGTAVAGSNYLSANGVVSFAEGERVKTIYVTIVDDTSVQGIQSFNVTLSHPQGGATIGSPSVIRVDIQDNEVGPGTVDTSYDPGIGANDLVRSLAVLPDDRVLIGGAFTSFNGLPHNYFVRLNQGGSLDTNFLPSTTIVVTNPIIVTTIDPIYGTIYTYTNGYIISTNVVGSGPDGMVSSIGVYTNGKIVLGGAISSYNGTNCSHMVRLLSDGRIDPSVTQTNTLNGGVNSVAASLDGKLYAGGGFTLPTVGIARFRANGTPDIAFDPGLGVNGPVFAVALQTWVDSSLAGVRTNEKVLVAGDFTRVNLLKRSRVARMNLDGSLDETFVPAVVTTGAVFAVTGLSNGKVLIAGDFVLPGSSNRIAVARFNVDGTLDPTFTPAVGTNGPVYAMQVQADGKILIGGDFTAVNNVPRSRMARLNMDGTVDISFNLGTGPDNTVFAIGLLSDGKIIIGGSFTDVNGYPRKGVARLNNDSAVLPVRFLAPAIIPAGGLRFTFTSQPGYRYAVEASTNLVNWQGIITNIAVGVTLDYTEPSPRAIEHRFFRVRVLNP